VIHEQAFTNTIHDYSFPITNTAARFTITSAALAMKIDLTLQFISIRRSFPHFRNYGNVVMKPQGWNHQAIERQLAHAERNAVSAPYNFAEHLPERRKMMQAWADYLDYLKAGAEVIELFKKA
jgi:hypothetical protein